MLSLMEISFTAQTQTQRQRREFGFSLRNLCVLCFSVNCGNEGRP
jgi:hypothetical protein